MNGRRNGRSRDLDVGRAAGRRGIGPALAVGLLTAAGASAQPVTVMTYNQYLGADIAPLLAAWPEAFNATLLGILHTVAASRVRDRIALQARSIAEQRPDLVALQEVWRLGCIDFEAPPQRGCADPSIAAAFNDQLALTLAALAARGASDTAAGTVTNFNLDAVGGIPFVVNGYPALLTVADRDVVLPISVTVPTPNGDVTVDTAIERGFVAVDATVRGRPYRFVSTHLEVKDPPVPAEIQCAQAGELVGILAATLPPDRSLVVAGDFNSGPNDGLTPGVLDPPPGLPAPIAAACFGAVVYPPYIVLTEAGLSDAWTFRSSRAARVPPSVDGYTCCQPENLRNNASRLNDRIDLILTLPPPALVSGARVVGDTVPEKTFPFGVGVWPSDHGGVVAQMTLSNGSAVASAARTRLAQAH